MSVLRLFTAAQTRGSRPQWVLEELGMPYELVDIERASAEERRHRHPLGRVPALEDGELTLFESAALCLYIADKDPEHRLLAPSGTAERARTEQWLFFLMTELESALDVIAFHTADLPEPERIDAIVPWARKRFDAAARIVDDHLASADFVVAGRLTIVDIVLACMMSWATRRDLLGPFPHIRKHLRRMLDRPVAKRIFGTYPPS